MVFYQLLKILIHAQVKLVKTWAINIAKNFFKTASKRATQKTAEAIPDLIGNKTANKLTSLSKIFSQKDEANNEIEIPKEKFISLVKRQQVIDELRLA